MVTGNFSLGYFVSTKEESNIKHSHEKVGLLRNKDG